MARIDDYRQAHALAAKNLASQEIDAIILRSGLEKLDETRLSVSFLGRNYHITAPAFDFIDADDPSAEVPLQEQVLILHYLQGCQPVLQGQWIAYREIPGAGFYFGAFVKRAIDPLKKVFGQNVALLNQAAAKLGATPIETGSAGFQLAPLPYAPLQYIVWEGDEEFEPEANILFDASVGSYLSPEDAAWLASLVVYRLMALTR